MNRFRFLKLVFALAILAPCYVASQTDNQQQATDDLLNLDTSQFEPQVAEEFSKAITGIKTDPFKDSPWGQLGRLLHAHEMYRQAERAYLRANQLNPFDASMLHLAGIAAAVEDPDRAIEHFRESLKLQPNYTPGVLRMAFQYERIGEATVAALFYQELVERDPSLVHALTGLARCALRNGHLDEALEKLDQAKAIAPNHGAIHPLLAQIYARLGLAEQAELAEIFSHAFPNPIPIRDPVLDSVEDIGRSASAVARRGIRLAARGDLIRAEALFREAMVLRQPQVQDYNNLGVTLAHQNRYSEAADVFEQGLDSIPSDVELLSNKGLMQLKMGRNQESLETLEHALTLDPNHQGVLFNLASVHLQQERFTEAVPLLERAIAVNPGFIDARLNLGAAYITLGMFEKAADELELLTKFRPNDINLLYSLGSAYILSKSFNKAMNVMSRGLELSPENELFQRAVDDLEIFVTN